MYILRQDKIWYVDTEKLRPPLLPNTKIIITKVWPSSLRSILHVSIAKWNQEKNDLKLALLGNRTQLPVVVIGLLTRCIDHSTNKAWKSGRLGVSWGWFCSSYIELAVLTPTGAIGCILILIFFMCTCFCSVDRMIKPYRYLIHATFIDRCSL